ncbi:MAG: N-acetyltransferase [Flavobacteriaceae bacterium]|nr:MAG: N-acetyltransferase [Flavobacteriaceae bacterium]
MIRTYKETDLEDIMVIWLDAQTAAHPFLSADFVDNVKTLMREKFIPNSKTWVYELDGDVIGFIAMMGNEIGGLFVKPNNQSNGIGALLVDYVSQIYKDLEVEVFNENKIGKPFYFKQGFTIISDYIHEATDQKVLRMQRN